VRRSIPVIPAKANEKEQPAVFARAIYKGRIQIENAFGKFKRIFSLVSLGAVYILMKSVQRA
jgi:IS4 transposase